MSSGKEVDPCKSLTQGYNEGELRKELNKAFDEIPKQLNVVLNELRKYLLITVKSVDIGIGYFELGVNTSTQGINEFTKELGSINNILVETVAGNFFAFLQLIIMLILQNIPGLGVRKTETLKRYANGVLIFLALLIIMPLYYAVFNLVSFMFYISGF